MKFYTIVTSISTLLRGNNADGGVHKADYVIAKPPCNIEVMKKVLQWEPRGYHVITESAL